MSRRSSSTKKATRSKVSCCFLGGMAANSARRRSTVSLRQLLASVASASPTHQVRGRPCRFVMALSFLLVGVGLVGVVGGWLGLVGGLVAVDVAAEGGKIGIVVVDQVALLVGGNAFGLLVGVELVDCELFLVGGR